MPANVAEILAHYERLYGEQSAARAVWMELAEFICPSRSQINQRRTKGAKKTSSRLFDSTAQHANDILSSSMQGSLTSISSEWFNFLIRDEEVNEDKDVQDWLEDTRTRMYRAFNASNFQSEVHESYRDLSGMGIMALLMEEREVERAGFNGFHFESWPVGEFVVDEDAEGVVNTVMRKFDLPAGAVVKRFGAAAAGEKIRQLAEKRPEEAVIILHSITPRDGVFGYAAAHHKPFASCYLAYEHKHLIRESGYDEMPVMVPRWSKISGEKYGTGLGHIALPDIRTLNKLVELELKELALSVHPPFFVADDGVMPSIRWVPGGAMAVRDVDKSIKPYQSVARHDVAQVKVDRLQATIRQIFFNDKLQMPDKTIITAAEVHATLELMQQLLGPTLGRLQNEFLTKMINRGFNLMYRAGAFAEPPAALSGAKIDIEYEGQLARAARMADVNAVNRFLQTILPISQAKPEVLDVVNWDMTAYRVAERVGLPSSLTYDVRQLAANRAAAQKVLQDQQELATVETLAKSAGSAAPLLQVLQGGEQQQAAAPGQAAA